MAFEIKNIESGESRPCAVRPEWISGIWECGDFRVTDESGTENEVIEQAPPPTVGPITFQLLWTEAERVAIDDLVETNKAVRNFKKLLDDPRTDAVVMALPSIQNSIETTLTALAGAGVITEGDVPVRKAEILAGVMK
jgi:hypothetical protein